MKEECLEDVLDLFFKSRDSCTMPELHQFIDEYSKKNNVYVPRDRDEMNYTIYVLGRNKFYWDAEANVLRKQIIIMCPCCGTEHKKYPNTKLFNEIKAWFK